MVYIYISAIICPWSDFGLPILDVHRLCPAIEGRSSYFLLMMGSQSVIRQGKSLEIFHRGQELNPDDREEKQ